MARRNEKQTFKGRKTDITRRLEHMARKSGLKLTFRRVDEANGSRHGYRYIGYIDEPGNRLHGEGYMGCQSERDCKRWIKEFGKLYGQTWGGVIMASPVDSLNAAETKIRSQTPGASKDLIAVLEHLKAGGSRQGLFQLHFPQSIDRTIHTEERHLIDQINSVVAMTEAGYRAWRRGTGMYAERKPNPSTAAAKRRCMR
jgi:hypothetical protein